MTNFLPAGIINETLDECQQIKTLKELMDAGEHDKVGQGLDVLEKTALELWVFEKFSCQPLIYTGKGNTDEIIRRLDWALTLSRN